MADATPPAQAGGPTRGAEGITSFVTRVLEQLAISAWLPAAMLIGVGTLLVQLHQNEDMDIPQAVQDIAAQPWGVIVILLFGLVLTTMVTQAFSFGIIRLLEGYWGPNRLLDPLTKYRVKRHLSRKDEMAQRVSDLHQQLFESARATLLREEDRDYVDVWEADAYEIPKNNWRQKDPAIVEEASAIDWREKADPTIAALFYRAYQKGNDYPAKRNRVLPTTLGNVLRAAEEELQLSGQKLERFVMDNYRSVPQRLMTQHDQFRDRLEMYSLLVLVFSALAGASIPLLTTSLTALPWVPPIGGLLVLGALAWLSYRAAIASARGYGSTLLAMDAEVRRRKTASEAPHQRGTTEPSSP